MRRGVQAARTGKAALTAPDAGQRARPAPERLPRIAHVISTRGMGGAERFLATLVVAGADRGFEQVVLNPFAVEASHALAALCHPVPYEAQACDRLVELPALYRWLRARLDGFGPDIVHVVLFQAQIVVTLRKRPGTKLLLTNVGGDWVRTAPRGRLIALAERWAGRRFDRVVAISEAVRTFLVSEYRFPESKVTCIPLGWRGDPRPPSTLPRPPTVICVAALRPEKGHDVLLAAFAKVHEAVPGARLVLVGDGALRQAIQGQAAAAGIQGSVDFVGSVADVWEHLAGADVFALASRSEAFGIAIAEAMAAGLPVVAPAVGAISELVEPGVTGELFPAGDVTALAGHLARLLTSPETRAAMSAAALAAAEPLRVERAVDRYFDLYAELLPRQGVG